MKKVGISPKRKEVCVQWDEEAINLHNKDRGTRYSYLYYNYH
jgi:hypothetical protein